MPIGPGTKLGQYVVQDYIGEGAMGVVYRAYHPDLERVGAVKVLHGLTVDAESAARFRREAQAIAHMRHPNIVNVFDFGDYQGTLYMIVEYVEGGNLSTRLRARRLDHAKVISYLTGIAEAIDYAHSRGIVHRDIKPANVLLTNSDTPILADFGLVKMMLSTSVKSMTGVSTGTPAYMAPEQVSGTQVGPAADRYSFAVMAYEMLTGSIPFFEGGVLEVMYAQVNQRPAAPSSRAPELSATVDAVLLRGLAKDPKARWESCGAIVAALEKALGAEAGQGAEKTMVMAPPAPEARTMVAPPPAPFAPAPAAQASTMAPPPVGLPELRYRPGRSAVVVGPRRRVGPWLYWAAAALILILVAGAYFAYASLPPTVSVSPNPAHPGDHLVVSVQHLPANQNGTIQGLGPDHAITTDIFGNLSLGIDVPDDARPGDYTLSVCLNDSCPTSIVLHVVAAGT